MRTAFLGSMLEAAAFYFPAHDCLHRLERIPEGSSVDQYS